VPCLGRVATALCLTANNYIFYSYSGIFYEGYRPVCLQYVLPTLRAQADEVAEEVAVVEATARLDTSPARPGKKNGGRETAV